MTTGTLKGAPFRSVSETRPQLEKRPLDFLIEDFERGIWSKLGFDPSEVSGNSELSRVVRECAIFRIEVLLRGRWNGY